MQRRTVLKNLLLLAGGTALLPSCLHSDKKISIPLHHLSVSADQESLLAAITEAIIPKTDTPGAKELGIHQFVLVMMDDCATKEEQQKFLKGLSEVNNLAKKEYDNDFTACTAEQQTSLLARIDKKELKGDVNFFLDKTKRLTIQGYLKSKYVMSNLLRYELVPGRFHGSVPVTAKSNFLQNG